MIAKNKLRALYAFVALASAHCSVEAVAPLVAPVLSYGPLATGAYILGKFIGVFQDQQVLTAEIVKLTGENAALVNQTLAQAQTIAAGTQKVAELSGFFTPQLFYGAGITLGVVAVAGGGWYLYRKYNPSAETLKTERKMKQHRVKLAVYKCLADNKNSARDSDGMPLNCKDALKAYLDVAGPVKYNNLKSAFLARHGKE